MTKRQDISSKTFRLFLLTLLFGCVGMVLVGCKGAEPSLIGGMLCYFCGALASICFRG